MNEDSKISSNAESMTKDEEEPATVGLVSMVDRHLQAHPSNITFQRRENESGTKGMKKIISYIH